MKRKISYFLNPTGWAKPLENGFIPPLDGSDGDVGVRVPEFYMCVKDTGIKYQLWISDFNIDGTFTRIHPFIISHTKTMTRTREDGKEEVFSACIKHDDTRYLGGNKSSSIISTKLQGRPRTGINYDKANEFYHTHTLIRKSIKYKIIRLVNSYLNREIDKREFKVRMCAYYGWLKHADAKNLLYKIQSLTDVRYSNWNGKRTNIAKYYGKYVRIIQVINYAKYFRINFIRNGKAYYADSRDKTLFYSIHRLNHFPINFKITKYDWRIYTKNRKEKVKLKT